MTNNTQRLISPDGKREVLSYSESLQDVIELERSPLHDLVFLRKFERWSTGREVEHNIPISLEDWLEIGRRMRWLDAEPAKTRSGRNEAQPAETFEVEVPAPDAATHATDPMEELRRADELIRKHTK